MDLGIICQKLLTTVVLKEPHPIKTTKGYPPKGTENKIKYIDSSHTIKRNLLLRIK